MTALASPFLKGNKVPHSGPRHAELDQTTFATAANGRKEPVLPIFCNATNVCNHSVEVKTFDSHLGSEWDLYQRQNCSLKMGCGMAKTIKGIGALQNGP